MEGTATSIFDDALLRRLEAQYREAVVKVFCPTRSSNDTAGWTGFVVNPIPCLILMVSHPIRNLRNIQHISGLFHVNFFGDTADYEAVAVEYVLVLHVNRCETTPPTFFRLADPNDPILSCTSFFSISHPEGRNWTTMLGRISRDPFPIGKNDTYRENLLIFDHNAALYPGASGAPIINVNGEVIGMQLTQLTRKFRSLCIDKSRQSHFSNFQLVNVENFNSFNWEVKELSLLSCDLRQAITIQSIGESIRDLFPMEGGYPPSITLNNHLRWSVSQYLNRRGGSLQGSSHQGTQSKEPPPRDSSGKRPRKKSVLDGKGLASLHENCNPNVLHRQVEADEILLGFISNAENRIEAINTDPNVTSSVQTQTSSRTKRKRDEAGSKEEH